MQFRYTDVSTKIYDAISEKRIIDCPSKHVLRLNSEKARELQKESQKQGYSRIWGYNYGLYRDEEKNRNAQLYTIARMIYEEAKMPFRVVINQAGTPWIDNLHSAIRDVLVYGDSVKIKDVPHYIVDMSGDIPVVCDVKNSINMEDIKGAVRCAMKCDRRINDNISSINYTIGEFITENEITREELGINSELFEEYKEVIL